MVKKPKKVKDHFQRHHPVSQQIVGLLEEAQVWFETFEHPPVRTSEEAEHDGLDLSEHAEGAYEASTAALASHGDAPRGAAALRPVAETE